VEVGGGIGVKERRFGEYKGCVELSCGIQIRQELAAPPRKLDAEGFTCLVSFWSSVIFYRWRGYGWKGRRLQWCPCMSCLKQKVTMAVAGDESLYMYSIFER